MGKHSNDKFYCEFCDKENHTCENRAFHLQQYRRHYYLVRKYERQNNMKEVEIKKEKITLNFS